MNQPFDFTLFDKHSKEDWRKAVSNELKGEDPFEELKWKTQDDLILDPMYFSEDTEEVEGRSILDGKDNEWFNLAAIDLSNSNTTPELLRSIIGLVDGFRIIGKSSKVTKSLLEVAISAPCIHWSLDSIDGLKNWDQPQLSEISGNLGFSIQDQVKSKLPILEELSNYYQLKKSKIPNCSTIIIRGSEFVKDGASVVNEVGLITAELVEAYSLLKELKVSDEEIGVEVEIETAIGSDHFQEIAKIRAIKRIVSLVQDTFSMPVQPVKIHCSTSFRNKSFLSHHNNLVRSGTEALAAVVGGCNTLTIHPHELDNPNTSNLQIAANISNLLKYESFLSRVIDPARGAYYIESLTDDIGRMAWDYFKTIEERGGFASLVHDPGIFNELKSDRLSLSHKMTNNEIKLVGVNQFKTESQEGNRQLSQTAFRLAEPYEQ